MEFIVVFPHPEDDIFIDRLNIAIEYFLGFSHTDRDYLGGDGYLYPKKYIIIAGALYYGHLHKNRSEKDPEKYAIIYNKLLENGIDQRYLLYEDKSKNTEDNITCTHELIRGLFGMNPFFMMYNSHMITFCTSTFHIKRVCAYAKFLLGNLYYMNFLHTHEKVPEYKNKKEEEYILNFILKTVRKEINF